MSRFSTGRFSSHESPRRDLAAGIPGLHLAHIRWLQDTLEFSNPQPRKFRRHIGILLRDLGTIAVLRKDGRTKLGELASWVWHDEAEDSFRIAR